MLGDKIDVKKKLKRLWLRRRYGTDDHESYAGRNYSLSAAGITGFLDILYGNPFGICAMTVCLTVYGAAYWMGKRIVEIEV